MNSNRLTRFHRWLLQNELQLSDFRPGHIEEFVKKPFRKKTKPNVGRSYRRWLFAYLSFLYEKKLLSFNPEHARGHPKYFPAHASEFLEELAVTLKPGTANGYRTALRSFHNFIDRNNLTLRELDRLQICQWLHQLAQRGLHPSTRRAIIIQVRTYLRWLHEREILPTDPQPLIRSSDLPKLPEYLPRPLAPQTDKALQDLLTQWKTIYAKGLLLMRKTGIRIGELEALDYDCLRTDLHGNCFLKVPLGKLNNERLVPINPETTQLVEQIKQRTPSPRKYLISTTATKKEKRQLLIAQIKRASKKLSTPIQSHQLRHTCATELMSAGMSLPSIMRFLGHRDYRMTLRYAKITQETLVREFCQVTEQIGKRYNIPLPVDDQEPFDAGTLLSNVISWLLTNAPSHRKRDVDLLTKRLHRIKRDIKKIQTAISRAA